MDQSPFIKLPRELRDKINAYVLGGEYNTLTIYSFNKAKHSEVCGALCIHRILQEGWLTACKETRSESTALLASTKIRAGRGQFFAAEAGHQRTEETLWAMRTLMDWLDRNNASPVRALQIDFDIWAPWPKSPPAGLVRCWKAARKLKARMSANGKLMVRIRLAVAPYEDKFELYLPLGDGEAIREETQRKAAWYAQSATAIQRLKGYPIHRPDMTAFVEYMEKLIKKLGE